MFNGIWDPSLGRGHGLFRQLSTVEYTGQSTILVYFSNRARGGSSKYLRKVCRKFVPAVIRYPPTNFFHKLHFFSSSFSGPTNFFRKYNFFPLKFGDPPTFLRKIQIYLFFDPLTKDIFLYSKVYSVIFGFLTSFKSFFRYISM